MHAKCKRCGMEGLVWAKRDNKWRLHEFDHARVDEMKRLNKIITKLHECNPRSINE